MGMETALSNINGKIWLFIDVVVEWELLIDTEQQLTIKVLHHEIGKHIIMTVVYAKCSSLERLELWDNLYYLASDMELPWVVGGYFNMILNEEERIGGLPVYPPEYEDFAFCINSCELFDTGYTDFVGDPFLMFKQKIKRLKAALSHWSKITFGDIFKQLAIIEDIVRIKEMLLEEEPTNENRIILQQAQAALKRYLSIEEQYWKQKTGMKWFAEGDRNTTFFNNYVNGKRQKLQLKRIQNANSDWLEDQEGISNAATTFFQTQFTEEGQFTSSELLNNVPTMISTDQNTELCRFTIIEEVKNAVITLSGDSASGPNGFTGLIF
nr:uncharacterized protein LOC108945273 [Nicotiana tomentosiformis]